MIARLRKLLDALGNAFWPLPAVMVVVGILAAFGLIAVDRSGLIDSAVLQSDWLYNGGGTGARTLLGAVAASTIGVAGTVFSITIAALSLAAGQMGPRLLQNFTRDRGNQVTLGTFLGTFSYAMMVLRAVRTQSEGEFVPHLALSVAILLAFFCVATLVYFVGHMAGRINVDTVVDLVGNEVRKAIVRLTAKEGQPAPPPASYWLGSVEVTDDRRGYLQQLDADNLADWAAANDATIHLLIRPGEYLFPGNHCPDQTGRRRCGSCNPRRYRLGLAARLLRRPGIRDSAIGRSCGASALTRNQRPQHRAQRARSSRCGALRCLEGLSVHRRSSA